MHKNSHKKDELCIKTYFLHKKNLPRVCLAEEENVKKIA